MRTRKVFSVLTAGAMGLGVLAMTSGTAFAVGYGSHNVPTCSSSFTPMDGAGVQNAAATIACVTATETLIPGTLHFNSVSNVSFGSQQITGADFDAVSSPSLTNGFVDVTDATGSGAGWNVAISAPDLRDGNWTSNTATPNDVLPTANFDSSLAGTCDTGSTCDTIPAGSTSIPLSSGLLNAGASVIVVEGPAASSAGSQNFEITFDQPIPATANAATTYTATWTYTLASGPSTGLGSGSLNGTVTPVHTTNTGAFKY